MSGISAVLQQLAESAVAHASAEKQAFIPMPEGQPPAPPMDPMAAMGGGMPPMDPAAMGGGGGMPPGMPPGMDPMSMAAMGQDPAAIAAASGVPVDPMMAAAGGATGIPAPTPEAAPEAAASAKGGGQKEKLDEIHSMLTKVLGVLVGKNLLGPEALGGMMGIQGGDAPPDSPPAGAEAMGTPAPIGPGVPAEQKVAADAPATVGSVVDDLGDLTSIVTPEQAPKVKQALGDLILSLNGPVRG